MWPADHRRRFLELFGILVGVLVARIGFSQPPPAGETPADSELSKNVTEPILPLNEPELILPPEAVLHGVGGQVQVRIQIDAAGTVIDAKQVSGLELFHETALETAYLLRFAPIREAENAPPREVVLNFEYLSPEAESDTDVDYEMVIEHEDMGPPDTRSVVHIGTDELERASSQDLGETVSMVAGVTLSRGSADTSKPIIRGLAERRLLLINDGVRHESQKWGADHAPEIDPHSAGRITIIKGASGVRYGPDAIGGVILVEPHALRSEDGVGGSTVGAYSTNGQRGFGALRLDGRSSRMEHMSFRVEGNYNRNASLSSPTYVLGNTGSETWNAGTTVGYRHGESVLKLRYQHFQQQAGIFYGIQNSTPEEFDAQLSREQPLTADQWTTTYAIDRPYQSVTHDLALAHGELPISDWGHLHMTYAFQRNHRKEYEQVRESVQGPQYDFILRTHTFDLNLEHIPVDVGNASLEGGTGLSSLFQENVYSGYTLIPNYRSFGGGIYAHERSSWNRFAVELGGRLDRLQRTAFLGERFYESHLRRETLSEEMCSVEDDVGRCPSLFNAASISLGALWKIRESLEFKLDFSSASRVPNADEAYMLSSAPTFPIYVYSDPGLGIETTWGASPTIGLDLPWLSAEVSGYANFIEDYIHFAPELDASGQTQFDVTIRGAFPRYSFRAIDARFHGVDGSLHLAPHSTLGLKILGSAIRAYDLETDSFLVGIPPDRLVTSGVAKWPVLGPLREANMELSIEGVARQSRADPSLELAPPPEGYWLLHASIGFTLPSRLRGLKLGIEGHNLLNTAVRDYTSLLRYYADQPGRDIRVYVSTSF